LVAQGRKILQTTGQKDGAGVVPAPSLIQRYQNISSYGA
jgi:hypothetical protein